ncbi:hypothetical protein PYW07_002999 [Mythimna separata]|uniref:Reverse transcriptase domain-containing protein n=1 Tax=Mythimna separata TaxID=271217 RepID=A0AAD8DQE6_MYTSE|nr:hypothetical protein PYW07_002999 [Mythimna separata]
MPPKRGKYFKVGFLNAGSLGTGHDDLISAIDRYGFDILALNETWLRPGEEGRAPLVPGYRLRHAPRPTAVRAGRGGGVGFYLRRGLSARIVTGSVDSRFDSVEQMWLKITLGGKKIAIGTAYRPPWYDLDLFLDGITNTFASLGNCDHHILLGDFNVNMINVSEAKTKKVLEFLNYTSLAQLVTEPTHFTDTSETLIDLLCTDLKARYTTVEAFGSITGHSLIISEFNVQRVKISPFVIKYRPIKDICRDSFCEDLLQLNLAQVSKCDNVHDMVDFFNNCLIGLFDVHAPLKTCTIKEQSQPWITDTLKLMMTLRDKALTVYRKTKNEQKKIYYKQLKSLVDSSIYNEKVAYFKHNINNNVKNPKLLWKNIKSTFVPSKQRQDLPSHFKSPDLINNTFLNVPGNPIASPSLILFYESNRHSEAIFSLAPVDQSDVSRIITELKSNAEGYDQITLSMITLTLPHTLPTITDIINCSLWTSEFPYQWKVAIVRPIPKCPNPIEVKDLRPISILSCLSKVLEKVVCRQLTRFLEENDLLPNLQSGFRKQRSTSTALLDVTDNILSAQDKGMCTLVVLLDFSRAFDCMNVSLLISKLKYYGFDDNAIQWFQSYLGDRKQLVELRLADGTTLTSALSAIARGVPQGSILGPIIFIIYCADIIKCLQKCKYHIYADDVQLYLSFKPEDYESAIGDLNDDLGRISAWADENCLSLNPVKTKYMLFGAKQQLKKLPASLNLTLMGEPVERVEEARNLGLRMDSSLRFEKHVAESVKNCFYRLKLLYKMRPFLSEKLREQLAETLVLSKLNYADTVYGPRLLSRTDRLIQRVQNACARFCYSVPPRSHVTPFLNKHFILKMKSRRKLHLACLLFGVVKTKQPKYLYDKLSWITGRRECAPRLCAQQLATQPHRTAAFRGSFRYAASKVWNNIPPPLRVLGTIYTFRTRLRQYLIDAQRKLDMVTLNVSFI